jgi:hypothetical protein
MLTKHRCGSMHDSADDAAGHDVVFVSQGCVLDVVMVFWAGVTRSANVQPCVPSNGSAGQRTDSPLSPSIG